MDKSRCLPKAEVVPTTAACRPLTLLAKAEAADSVVACRRPRARPPVLLLLAGPRVRLPALLAKAEVSDTAQPQLLARPPALLLLVG
ncbi:hypothetical protein E2562_008309 [Oryza meyeriana var. granulata]|uniref:Uncharacterized protein n=1 Tax=Oryza meyeriana var. granulata TaxID=110450 RepID=A0A6G1DF36_9ORYZ|nr:hypothetical protein E2562_008309 [Oryza meyeriana var. granulata]